MLAHLLFLYGQTLPEELTRNSECQSQANAVIAACWG